MNVKRQLATATLAVLVLAGSAAGGAIANGSAASAKQSPAPAGAGAGGPVLVGAVAAIERLVSAGTLTARQGNAIEQEIRSGSIDPKALVDAGVVSDGQMRAAAAAIDQVKAAGG